MHDGSAGRDRRVRTRVATAGLVAAVVIVLAACQPIRLGGPVSVVGNQVTTTDNPSPPTCAGFQPSPTPPCGPQPMVWTAINGPYELYQNGDPYSTKCGVNSNNNPCTPNNPLYRTTGYSFAVDVAPADVGRPLTVWVYDAVTSPRTFSTVSPRPANVDCWSRESPFNAPPYTSSGGSFSGSFTQNTCQTGDDGSPQNLDLQLHDNDGSDPTVDPGTPLPDCHLLVGAAAVVAEYKNRWASVCTFTPSRRGVYPLQVRNSGLPGIADTGDGYNAFSLQVSGGTATRMYPLGDSSVFLNTPGPSATMYLAEIPASYKGRTLAIDLFDPGDAGTSTKTSVQVKAPPGGTTNTPAGTGNAIPAPGLALGCSYNAVPAPAKGPDTPDVAADCRVTTKPVLAPGTYNGRWLRIIVQIDPAYRCASDCWWTLQYDFGGAAFPQDRVVWSLTIL